MNIARETTELRPTPEGDFNEADSTRRTMEALLNPPENVTPAERALRALRRSIPLWSWFAVLQIAAVTAPPTPTRAEQAARVLAALDSPVNFTNVRPALPDGPKVIVANTSPATFTPHSAILRLDGTSREAPVVVYGVTHWHPLTWR
jgi:hypothetical protein